MPSLASSEASRLAIVRAGERALLVAEDFRLEQRVGQRRAVDRLELRDAAPAQLVDHPRDDFLARSGRPENQHRDVRLGRGADPLEDDQHLLVAADHLAEALDRRRLVLGADRGAALEEMIEQVGDARRWRAARPCTAAERCRASTARRRSRRARARSSRRRASAARTSASATRRRTPRRAWRSGSAAGPRAAETAPATGTAGRDRRARPSWPSRPTLRAARAEGQIVHRGGWVIGR